MVRGIVHQKQPCAALRHEAGGVVRVGRVPVAPDVAVDDKERVVAQKGERLGDAARGLQRGGFGRIADAHAVRGAVAQRAFDFVAEPGVIDDDVADAGRGQARQMPDDQRLAADRQHGLGQAVGQRAHAFAAARGKNHGAHQNVYPTLTWRSSRRSSRRSSGVKTP